MRDLLHGALCALLITITTACGGGDPPGGGNNGTDGGGTTDGTTGNDGRNPLIDAIPGCWEIVSENCELERGRPETVTVDPSSPDCGRSGSDNLPGDACVHWFRSGFRWILDGDVVRLNAGSRGVWGQVLENGHRIVYTDEDCEGTDRPCAEPIRIEIDARWVRPATPPCNDFTVPFKDAEPRCTPEGGGAP